MDDFTIFLGIAISILDACIFLPQAIRVWQYRHRPELLQGLSLLTPILVLIAYSGWLFWDAWTGRWDAHAYVWVGIPAALFIVVITLRTKYRKSPIDSAHCHHCGQLLQ